MGNLVQLGQLQLEISLIAPFFSFIKKENKRRFRLLCISQIGSLNMVHKKAQLRPCLVSCSVLKEEFEQLVKREELDVDLVFVNKFFHVDYSLLEKNLREVLKHTLPRFPGGIILVYGDLCIGPKNEMKALAEEFGVAKVDAVNCTDCLLGGKGKFFKADPDHDFLFLNPGMIDFFKYFKEKAEKEGADEETIQQFFSDLKGIIFLDTLGETETGLQEIAKMNSGLPVLETKKIGVDKLKLIILEAIERNKKI